MSSLALRWYGVKIKVRRKDSRYTIIERHIEARDDKKAKEKARRYGEPISAYKLEFTTAGIEHLKLNQKPLEPEISEAIAMDEMIWAKRNKRIANQYKDKIGD